MIRFRVRVRDRVKVRVRVRVRVRAVVPGAEAKTRVVELDLTAHLFSFHDIYILYVTYMDWLCFSRHIFYICLNHVQAAAIMLYTQVRLRGLCVLSETSLLTNEHLHISNS